MRGIYTLMRHGWIDETIARTVAHLEARGLVADGGITAAGRPLRGDIEDRADGMQQPIVDAIGVELEVTVKALDRWSAACAKAGAFPPEPTCRSHLDAFTRTTRYPSTRSPVTSGWR